MSDGSGQEDAHEAVGPALDEEAELGSEEAALLHIGRYSEARRARPWEQWSFREKANFCLDQLFLGFLALFLLLLLGEVCYKVWYVLDVRKMAAFLMDSSTALSTWLFTQEEKEELLDL